MALSLGTLLAGRYEITAPIAVGGMGEVWKARDRVLDRTVAAKVLRSEFTGDPSFVARFRNEARHTAALSHPNIASVYDYGEVEDAVAGPPDLAHAAGGDGGGDLVPSGEDGARRQRHQPPCPSR